MYLNSQRAAFPNGFEQKFADDLDEKLREISDDYQAHRAKGYGLNPPKLLVAQPGTFRDWMKSRGKLGGQHKVPRVINDRELFQNLIDFVKNYQSPKGSSSHAVSP